MEENTASSLRVRIPLVFALFVILGSAGLLIVFERRKQAEEHAAFAESARVNAAFMQRTRLPRTELMAQRLSKVIGADVFFRDPATGRVVGAPEAQLPAEATQITPSDQVAQLDSGKLVMVVPDESGVQMIFLRDPRFRGLVDLGLEAWLAVGFFCLLSIALGFGMSRWLSSPLQLLVQAIPKVGTQEALPALPLERRDEIGSLARVLKDTHESLGEERERRRQAERLALLGRMATGIAHEIRNPAAAIRLHAELLDASDLAAMSKSQNLILNEAQRLENLVSQWMLLSRPEPPKTSRMDLVSLLREVVEVMAPQAAHMKVEMTISSALKGELLIEADRHRLHQVFANLILNAIQSMPTGGKLRVEIEEQADRVAVRVIDQGRGFSDSALKQAGEPFFSEREGGLGLGLAVAKDICVAHGGSIHFSNHQAGGACIRVELRKASTQNGVRS